MTTHSVTTVFNNKMAFTANINGHKVLPWIQLLMKMAKTVPPASQAVDAGLLTGCTGMDVVMILNKMKVPFSDFSIEVEADVRDEYPKIYTRAKLTYKIRMAAKDRLEKWKAVSFLSQEKYCSVSGMFRSFAKMETEIIILE